MSAASTLTAALTVAPIPLGPTHAAVIQDTVWLPIGTRVKVIKSIVSNIEALCKKLDGPGNKAIIYYYAHTDIIESG